MEPNNSDSARGYRQITPAIHITDEPRRTKRTRLEILLGINDFNADNLVVFSTDRNVERVAQGFVKDIFLSYVEQYPEDLSIVIIIDSNDVGEVQAGIVP